MQGGGKRGGAECAGPRLGHCPSPEFDSRERRRRSAVAWSIFARLLPAAQREEGEDLAVSAPPPASLSLHHSVRAHVLEAAAYD